MSIQQARALRRTMTRPESILWYHLRNHERAWRETPVGWPRRIILAIVGATAILFVCAGVVGVLSELW